MDGHRKRVARETMNPRDWSGKGAIQRELDKPEK